MTSPRFPFSASPGLRISASVSFLILCLAGVVSAGAASRKLVIANAQWGDVADEKAIDVTAKVAGMATDAGLSLIADAETLGDAKTAAPRQLKVGYTIDGVYTSKTVNEGEDLDISLRLIIRKAIYGDLPAGPSADVTEDVADLVRKNALSVEASNDHFGDPAGGVVKKLRVDYWYDGETKSKTVGENQTLKIP